MKNVFKVSVRGFKTDERKFLGPIYTEKSMAQAYADKLNNHNQEFEARVEKI